MDMIGLSHRSKQKSNGITKEGRKSRKSAELPKRSFRSEKPLERCVTVLTRSDSIKGRKRIIMIREAKKEDLGELLKLYLFLHEDSIPEQNEHLEKTWNQIIEDPNHHLIVNEIDGRIISSCVCVIIPNLTRNVRPYAFVENVVTHADYRGKGHAGECLNYAKKIAESENCYKMMLLTGSKKAETLRFYEKAGYNSSDKTAFIMWI